jgi:hypothetical protein
LAAASREPVATPILWAARAKSPAPDRADVPQAPWAPRERVCDTPRSSPEDAAGTAQRPHLRRAHPTAVLPDLDGRVVDLDLVLSDIAPEVARGWPRPDDPYSTVGH